MIASGDWQLILDDDPHKALELAQRVLDSEEDNNKVKDRLPVMYFKACALVRTGQYQEARNDFSVLISLLRENGPAQLELKALEEFAGLLLLFDDKEAIIEKWHRCFMLALDTESSEFVIKALCGIGKAFWEDPDYKTALRFHKQAVDLTNLCRDSVLVTLANLCLALDYLVLEEYALCLEIVESQWDIIQTQPNEHWRAEGFFYRAVSQLYAGQVREGEKNLAAAETLAERLNFWWLLVPLYREKHKYFLLENNLKAAGAAVEKGVRAAESSGSDRFREDINLQASQFFETMGDYEKALYYLSRANESTEKLLARYAPVTTKKTGKMIKKVLKKVPLARLLLINANMKTNLKESIDMIKTLEEQTTSDPLTHTFNRRAFRERMNSIASGKAEGLALIILDIDHFKSINDTFGHARGDAVLEGLGEILNANTRTASEAVFRYGGEEFCIILECAESDAALHLAHRLLLKIREYDWEKIVSGRKVTASIGVAFGRTNDVGNLFVQADEALYAAKEEGRNRIRSKLAPDFEIRPFPESLEQTF